MDFNVNARLKQLENLEQFIASSRMQLHSILDTIGWSEDKLANASKLVTCPENGNHAVPEAKLQEHLERCANTTLGYDPDEPFFSEPLNDPISSVKIDNSTKLSILTSAQSSTQNFKQGWNGKDPDPKTSDRYTSTYTADERLALYKYAKSVTKGPSPPPEFDLANPPQKEDNKELSYRELLEKERNAKRRRVKYKAVHTSRKNYTEVTRELIANQMNMYEDWVREQNIELTQPNSSGRCQESSRDVDKKYHRSPRESSRKRSRERSRSYHKEHSRKPERNRKSYSSKHEHGRDSSYSRERSVSHSKSRYRERSNDRYMKYKRSRYEK